MRKIIKATAALAILLSLSACGASGKQSSIHVVSREDGSGTRGAFTELFGIEEKNEAGEKVDRTTEEAEITNSTEVMLTTVAGDPMAIGYVSLGSLNDTVKSLRIDGALASVEEIKSGAYKISRPFSLVTGESISPLAEDFIRFVFSSEGQETVEKKGYIAVEQGGEYASAGLSGKLSIGGSSSVTPVMEKLTEAYMALNPGVQIEVQQSDSTTGILSVLDGVTDLGMSSRELKDSELEKGAKSRAIALDGIAVIVNKENNIEELSREQVKEIFTGELGSWDKF